MPIAQQIPSDVLEHDVLEHDALVGEPSVEVRVEFFDAPTQDVVGHGTQEVGVRLLRDLTEAGILILFTHQVGNGAL